MDKKIKMEGKRRADGRFCIRAIHGKLTGRKNVVVKVLRACESFMRSGVRLESVHQEPPHTGVFRKWSITFLVSRHF